MPPSINRPAALAVAALILVLPLSAVSCSAAQKAVDCGNTAVRLGSDLNEVNNAYNNANNDPAAAGRALAKLKADLDKAGKNSSSSDITKSIDDLQKQVDKVQQAVDKKQVPDLGPLGDAVGNFTKVCTG
ncbi:hypothetical protein [Kitasatospora azatica]|uniref:hypothetical protein n=1 Tax=Kitasatospora azatica TaxID=58347 RepID=UPI00055B13C7|nr:hypothetical protein [Kitasatospora azatica]